MSSYTDILTPYYGASSSPSSNAADPIAGGSTRCGTLLGLTTENPVSSTGVGFHPLKFHQRSRLQVDGRFRNLDEDAEVGSGGLAPVAWGGGGAV
jgi:hypothetical protein